MKNVSDEAHDKIAYAKSYIPLIVVNVILVALLTIELVLVCSFHNYIAALIMAIIAFVVSAIAVLATDIDECHVAAMTVSPNLMAFVLLAWDAIEVSSIMHIFVAFLLGYGIYNQLSLSIKSALGESLY